METRLTFEEVCEGMWFGTISVEIMHLQPGDNGVTIPALATKLDPKDLVRL